LGQVLGSSALWGSVEEDVHLHGDLIAGAHQRSDVDLSDDVLSGTESVEVLLSALESDKFAQWGHSSSHIGIEDVSHALLSGDDEDRSRGDEVGVDLFYFGSAESLSLILSSCVFAFLTIDAVGIASNVDDLSWGVAFLALNARGSPDNLEVATAFIVGSRIALKSGNTFALIVLAIDVICAGRKGIALPRCAARVLAERNRGKSNEDKKGNEKSRVFHDDE